MGAAILWNTFVLKSLVEQEMVTLPEHISSSTVIILVCVAQSLVFCVVFCKSLFFLLSFFFMTIVLSVIRRFTVSDYPFGI